MIRILSKSILASAALLASAGVSAQPNGTYIATPAAAPTKTVLMTRDLAWRARDGAYVTQNSTMREMFACQLVARSAGALTSFNANGQSFDTAQLDACNAKAKGGKAMAKTAAAPAPAN
jgi:hypothetical protein